MSDITPWWAAREIQRAKENEAEELDLRRYVRSALNTVPKEILGIEGLKRLDLRDHRIQEIPSWLNEIETLVEIDFRGNPLQRGASVSGSILDFDQYLTL